MNKARLAALLGIIGLSALASGVFAQDETFGLSEADNTFYNEAMAASANFSSLSYDFTLDLSVTGLGADEIAASLVGSGALDVGAEGGASLEVNGEIVSGEQIQPASLGLITLGDLIYFRLGDESTQWMGGTVESLGSQFMSGFVQGAGLPVNPDEVASGDMSGLQDALMSNPAAMQALTALSTLNVGEYVARERSDSGSIASFRTDVALGDLLGSEEFAPVLGALASAGGGNTATMTDAQMQQTSAMIASLFADAQISLTQDIDTTTNRVQGATVEIAIPLATMLTGGSEPGALALTFVVDLSGYDEPVSITAPENVQMMETTPAS